ncbi:MAG TPA: 2-phosphosulfolactate phosphatase [Thermoanaerobaculia bacterium]|nr:2-phosphosulfolactate phosphatase [Thermoanaerobaculia bacterium]
MNQSGFSARFEWGEAGLSALGPGSDAIVVVDVLCFTTCVDVAVARGAEVLPYRWNDGTAADYARQKAADLAGRRGERWSLSPQSFGNVVAGTRIVLPSPNGSALSFACDAPVVLAGCLRNAAAVARAARSAGPRVAVIAAGERWPDGSLRPCLEDLLGAGAVLSHLPGVRSPEAEAAAGAFGSLKDRLRRALADTASGRELISWGYEGDLDLAAELDVSAAAPRLEDGSYRAIG